MRKTSIAATLALVATVVVHLGAHAQLPPTAGGGAAPSAEAPPAAAPVPEEHASPRATMRTFLEATVAADANDDDTELDRAAACLDLRALPVAGRTDAGRELAIKLKEVIDRVRFVVYDDIPDARAGDPWVFYRAADGAPAIVIARADSGEWLFDAATVARVDDLYRELESHAKVAGVAGSSARLSASLWLRERMPDELKKVGFLFEHWQWLGLVVLFFLAVVISRAVRALLRGPVERWLMKRSLPVPSELVVRALRPIGLMALALTWTLGLPWLGLPPDANGVVILVVQLIAAFGFVRFAFKIVDIVAWELARRAALTEGRFDDLIVPLVQKSLKVVVFCVGVVFIADLAGISPTSLLAGLGLG
ncbi:MAG: hypothetical protein KC635_02060, partial [Myxococcales bacterium]|nr:hypothetical protein [Myxococcales bacterium]